MKILLTGMAGFIGFHLAKSLVNENFEIVGLDNLNTYYSNRLKTARLNELGFNVSLDNDNFETENFFLSKTYSNLKFIKLHVKDKEKLLSLFEVENFDYVIHLAAQAGVRYSLVNPDSYIDSNIIGFFNILECCRAYPIKHLIFASSSSVYGLNTKIPFAEDDKTESPTSLYAVTKKTNELMAHSYSHLFNIPITGLRFFTVYGPWGRPDMAYYSFAKNIMAGNPIKLFNNGNMKRDFTYIDDIVNGIKNLIHKTHWKFNIFNIGNNSPIGLLEFVKILEHHLNKEAIIEFAPKPPEDVEVTFANVDKLLRNTNFRPQTTLFEGLGKFCSWFLKYREKTNNEW